MRRDERGSALVELVWLGILLVLPVLWIVMSVFQVQRGAFGVSAAARAAARAYALAPDDGSGLVRARAAARMALDDLHAVPLRLPPGHLDHHRVGALPRGAAPDAERAGEQPAELRAGGDADGADRAVPGDQRWLTGVRTAPRA